MTGGCWPSTTSGPRSRTWCGCSRRRPAVGRVESAASAEEALVALGDGAAFDALFLDVRMPGLDGLELARVLRRFERSPAIVFVSAFDDAAVGAFELAALDYLVKPVSRRRLDEAIERVGAAGGARASRPLRTTRRWPVDALRGGGTRLLPRSSMLYLQAHGDYVRVASSTRAASCCARGCASSRSAGPAHGFVRVHRGFVVNLRRAVEVRPRLNGTAVLVMADGAEVPIARRQVGELRRKLGV